MFQSRAGFSRTQGGILIQEVRQDIGSGLGEGSLDSNGPSTVLLECPLVNPEALYPFLGLLEYL